jgi:AcrR family transcriptional regulator
VTSGGTLRDQQTEFTKQLLLDAARKVIMETDPSEFSMQKVAEEAGVSHRTVYRYFPSRQALIDAFSDWAESSLQGRMSLDELLAQRPFDARPVFERFDLHAEYFQTSVRFSNWDIRPSSQRIRDTRIREWFDGEFPDLDPYEADKAFAVIRHLLGIQTWAALRQRFGFQDGEVGEAVKWAIDELMNGLRDGRAPKRPHREEVAPADTADDE